METAYEINYKITGSRAAERQYEAVFTKDEEVEDEQSNFDW